MLGKAPRARTADALARGGRWGTRVCGVRRTPGAPRSGAGAATKYDPPPAAETTGMSASIEENATHAASPACPASRRQRSAASSGAPRRRGRLRRGRDAVQARAAAGAGGGADTP